jgi:hypothetical protein
MESSLERRDGLCGILAMALFLCDVIRTVILEVPF